MSTTPNVGRKINQDLLRAWTLELEHRQRVLAAVLEVQTQNHRLVESLRRDVAHAEACVVRYTVLLVED